MMVFLSKISGLITTLMKKLVNLGFSVSIEDSTELIAE